MICGRIDGYNISIHVRGRLLRASPKLMNQDLNTIDCVRKMVDKYVAKGPYYLYPDHDRVESVIEGLAKNLEGYGRAYCPCVSIEKCLETGRKYVCPCEPHHKDIASQRYCDCALFVSEEFLQKGGVDMAIKIGGKAPNFNLKGVDGNVYTLDSFKDAKVLVLIVSCNHCPYVVAYEDRMIEIQRDYMDRGVRLVVINPNNEVTHSEDSFDNMVIRAREKGFNFPYLRDKLQDIPKTLGARYTPEVYVFDQDRSLYYHGRIDDNYADPNAVRRHDLRDALDSILIGKALQCSETTAIGCTIKWK